MKFVSTRDPKGDPWTFPDALFQGLAPDGGLFVPQEVPPMDPDALARLRRNTFADTGAAVAAHLLGSAMDPDLVEEVARSALDFPVPVTSLSPSENLLELFHGPTLAFKDVGARFTARMMARLKEPREQPVVVLVATSGDTGGAVASAFHGLQGIEVVVLYPESGVSQVQAAQFTTLGGNVHALAVSGTFDDCQALLKWALQDAALANNVALTTANSINVGRLLPQAFYYVHAWGAVTGGRGNVVFSVPSGNFGNLTAGLLARRLGVPVSVLMAATNANRIVPHYLETGEWTPRPSVATLSTAMDVGNPSNFERVLHLFGGSVDRVRNAMVATSWTDQETADCIESVYLETGTILDPHTAVAVLGLRSARSHDPVAPGIALATAHPAKFGDRLEPLIGRRPALPPLLEQALSAPRRDSEIGNDREELREFLMKLT